MRVVIVRLRKISCSGSLPSVHARACGNEAVVTSLFLVKKDKVTLR